MKIKQTVLTTLIILAIVGSTSFVLQNKMKSKIAYVEIKKLFNGFQMKKEMEEKYKATESKRNKILDSLSFNLKLMGKELNEQRADKKEINSELAYAFEYKREEFFKLKQQFTDDNAMQSQKYDAQILERMTQYIMEYGKANGYDFIYGADGNGNLMYAKDGYNISDEITIFINNKYKGVE